MEKLPISLCVVTRNSAERLEKMLKKHKDIIAEILVAVQDSDDDTFKIAEKYADIVFRKRKKGVADPDRNWLFAKASYEWVLYLDDDEYLDEATIKALPELIKANVDIYWLKTKNLVDKQDIYAILGDDPHPRLFRKGKVRYVDQVTPLDHTYPQAAPGSHCALVNYHIVHDRTLEKIIASNRARNKLGTPEQVKMQEDFIAKVQELVKK